MNVCICLFRKFMHFSFMFCTYFPFGIQIKILKNRRDARLKTKILENTIKHEIHKSSRMNFVFLHQLQKKTCYYFKTGSNHCKVMRWTTAFNVVARLL